MPSWGKAALFLDLCTLASLLVEHGCPLYATNVVHDSAFALSKQVKVTMYSLKPGVCIVEEGE